MKAFIKRLLCFHRRKKCWRIIAIGWDGTSTVQCQHCGKIREIPLQAEKRQ